MAKNKRPYHHTKNYNPAVRTLKYCGADQHVIQMFAAFAIVLKENMVVDGQPITGDDVEDLLGAVQKEWNDSINYGYDIADKCATLYDIDVRRAGK